MPHLCIHKAWYWLFKNISQYEPTPLAITSDPARVCLCSSHLKYNCTTRNLTLAVMRGDVIHLLGNVVDQDQNPKASFIRAHYNESEAKLGEGEGRRSTSNTTIRELSYHIFTRQHFSYFDSSNQKATVNAQRFLSHNYSYHNNTMLQRIGNE